jgi:hypothetical protein
MIFVVERELQLYLVAAGALVLQVGLNISFEMSPAKHQISSSNG